MERCLQKQMRAENWKWAEGRQTSFVFCCLVESTLYQLLEGFMSRVCECSSLRMYRRSLFQSYLIGQVWALFCGSVWQALFLIIQYDFQQCSNMSIQLSAVVVFWVYCSCCCFFICCCSSTVPWKSFSLLLCHFGCHEANMRIAYYYVALH